MKLSKIFLALLTTGLLSCGLLSQQAQATAINGAITFKGGCRLDTGNVNTANAVIAWSNTAVESVSGDFATFINSQDLATISAPWVFDPSTPCAGLWTVGGFTFDLMTSTIVHQGGGFLSISGTGTILGNGFDATLGTWSFSTQSPSSRGVFSFSASGQSVPDGGSAVALLGLALTGIEGLRRKLRRG
jgi:hypothetical protein